MKRQKPSAGGNIVPLKPAAAASAGGADGEVSALIQTLGETDRRLEELTAGEVDTVSDREGRTFVLRRAQDRLRQDEALKQAAALAALRKSEASFRALIEQASDGIVVTDERRRFVLVNQRFCEMLGYTESELLGLSIEVTYAPGYVDNAGRRWENSGKPAAYLVERLVRRKDGSVFPAEISVSGIGADHRQGIMRDVTVRERGRQMQELEHAVGKCLAESDSAGAGLRSIIQLICEAERWDCGRYFALDEAAGVMRFAEGWSVGDAAFEKFIAGSPGQVCRAGIGLVGNAWQAGTPTWVPDITLDSRAQRGDAGLGVHGAFFFPVRFEGRICGMFVFDSRLIRPPDEPLLRTFDAVGAQIGQFVVRKAQQLRIAHLSRIHAVLSGINSAIVRVQGREELFREACRIAVDSGGFRLAWIGVVDAASQAIVPAAWNGDDGSYVRQILALREERSMAVSAVAEREVMVANDIRENSPQALREEALKRGFHSMAALPLLVDGAAVGVLSLYAGEVGYFSDDEVSLLRDLAGNIAFAIDHIGHQERLVASESRFRQMADNIRDIFYLREADGSRMLYVSPAFETIFGRSRESLYANPASWGESIHPEDSAAARGKSRVPDKFEFDYRIVRPDGTIRWVETRGFPIHDDAGRVARIAGVVTDITERKEAERRIAYLNRVYAMLSGINTLIVRAGDRDELFREACRIAVEAGGFRMSLIALRDPAGTSIVPVASAGKEDALLDAIRARLSSPEGAQSTMVARALREKKPVISNQSQSDPGVVFQAMYAGAGVRSQVVLPLVVGGDAVGVLALYAGETEFFHDEEMKLLTELAGDIAFAIDHIGKQERLHYLAYHDELTGLANRTLFHQRLQQSAEKAATRQHALALVLLDVERFKTVNDTLGRAAGDTLLKELAARMGGYAGASGRLARIDADHFAIMVQDVQTGDELARLIEQRVKEVFGPPFRIGDTEQRLSAKFGIAMFPQDGTDADSLFRNAEAALKSAKTGGERYMFYTQDMNAHVAEKLSLENRLRQAIERGEFVLHYQPKVDLLAGRLTGAEALIRWNDPLTGLVPPGRFIPILEETGLIGEVGRWALRQALADYLRWRGEGLAAVRVAVNVSPLQLRNERFIAEIREAVGVDAHAAAGLELEITESLIMEDVKHSVATLEAIRALGVTVAIDDFGTGFSSLSHLSRLPVDKLKIDRSFVTDMTSGPRGLALVSTIIELAHAMKLTVVAEGVETEEQSRLLRLMGCDEMQGFLYSRPVPAEAFKSQFLLARSPA